MTPIKPLFILKLSGLVVLNDPMALAQSTDTAAIFPPI